MIKKIFLATALLLGVPALSVSAQQSPAQQETMADAPVVAELPDSQLLLESDAVPAEGVNTIEESNMANKMTQAEKAQNAAVNDRYGFAITLTAMCIVLFALIVLSLLFLGFGKASSRIMEHKKLKSQGISKHEAEDHHKELATGETIAAIAFALDEHFHGNEAHDLEDTILTIRKLRKAYSPWNSKIYNLRQTPELHRNVRK